MLMKTFTRFGENSIKTDSIREQKMLIYEIFNLLRDITIISHGGNYAGYRTWLRYLYQLLKLLDYSYDIIKNYKCNFHNGGSVIDNSNYLGFI